MQRESLLDHQLIFLKLHLKLKLLIGRAEMVARANKDMFKRKSGTAVVAVRRAGSIHAFNSINHFFLIGQMIAPGSSYWNISIDRQIGHVKLDEEGISTMETLGHNIVWLMKKINHYN
jgi:multimeric flavodoxin WrbA